MSRLPRYTPIFTWNSSFPSLICFPPRDKIFTSFYTFFVPLLNVNELVKRIQAHLLFEELSKFSRFQFSQTTGRPIIARRKEETLIFPSFFFHVGPFQPVVAIERIHPVHMCRRQLHTRTTLTSRRRQVKINDCIFLSSSSPSCRCGTSRRCC